MSCVAKKSKYYDFLVSKNKLGIWALFLCSFADASFLPAPAATFFLILVTLNKDRTLEYITSATLGILSGSILAYFAGNTAFFTPEAESSQIVKFISTHISGFSAENYNKIHVMYSKWGFGVLFLAAFTPVPYGILSVFAGAFGLDVFIFLIATIISHGIKFWVLSQIVIKIKNQTIKSNIFKWRPDLTQS